MSYTNQDIHNAAGPGSSAEPSMEEILASIRRILKEDEPGKPTESANTSVEMDDDVLILDESMIAKDADLSTATTLPSSEHPAPPLTPVSEPLHVSSEPLPFARDFAPAARAMPEPVVELPAAEPADAASKPDFAGLPAAHRDETELRQAASNIEPLRPPTPLPAAEPALAMPPALPKPYWETARQDDEQTATPEPVPAPAPDAASPDARPPGPASPSQTEAAPNDVYAPDHMPETIHAAIHEPQTSQSEPKMNESTPDGFQPPDSLISDQATSAAASSIGALVRSMTTEKSIAVSKGSSITIEDIVRDEIRPLLKSWLDSHLPSLVERIVRIEIERVISRSVV